MTDEVRGQALTGLRARRHRAGQLERVPQDDQGAAGDRPRARGRLPAHRHRAVGEGGRRPEPGAGQPRAHPGRARGRADHQVAATVRRVAHGRVPGAGRHRGRRWPVRSTRPWATACAMSSRPSRLQNLAAYDAYLKGEAASQALAVGDPASLRRAIGFYQQAVALDSGFVPAWAQLARAQRNPVFQRHAYARAGRAGPGGGEPGAGARP